MENIRRTVKVISLRPPIISGYRDELLIRSLNWW